MGRGCVKNEEGHLGVCYPLAIWYIFSCHCSILVYGLVLACITMYLLNLHTRRIAACLLLWAFAQYATAQAPTQPATNSHHYAVYRVPAQYIYQWMLDYNIDFAYLNTQEPIAVCPLPYHIDSLHLPKGHYVQVRMVHGMASGSWHQVSNVDVAIYQAAKKYYISVIDGQGQLQNEGTLWLNGKKMRAASRQDAYNVRVGKWEEAWVMACTPGDTLIAELDKGYSFSRYYQNNAFKNWPVVKTVLRVKNRIRHKLRGGMGEKRRKKLRTTGFVLFHQPLYKPGDTLKLKAWLTNLAEKPLTEPQKLSINYYKNNRYHSHHLTTLYPVEPGSFVYEMALPDSFPNDTKYQLSFRGKHDATNYKATFRMESYTLPDISNFYFGSRQPAYMTKDTLMLMAVAKDANGLGLMDGTLEIALLTSSVQNWQADTCFVPDTLYKTTLPLRSDVDTTYIPITQLQALQASVDVTAVALLRNSNNELQEKKLTFEIWQQKKAVAFVREQNLLHIQYKEDEQSLPAMARLIMTNERWQKDSLLLLPASIRIHPMAEEYEVEIYNAQGKLTTYGSYMAQNDAEQGLLPTFTPDFTTNTLGFVMHNPAELPVHLTLHSGNSIVWQHTTSAPTYSHYRKTGEHKLLRFKASWLHDGKVTDHSFKLLFPYKVLQVQAQAAPLTEPGSRDTLRVMVKDYKGKPAAHVNLTAVGYNNQLKDALQLPELPYTYQFKNKKLAHQEDLADIDIPHYQKSSNAAPLQQLLMHTGADTMQWYQWLYQKAPVHIKTMPIRSNYAQVAVHAQERGLPTPLYIVYLNNKPIYSHLSNTSHAYSHECIPGYAKIAIRTRQYLITLDSIYLQPRYKHDIFCNIDSLLTYPKARVEKRPDTLTYVEKNNLAQHFMMVENKQSQTDTWLWNGAAIHHLKQPLKDNWVVGPFPANAPVFFWKKGEELLSFPFEPNYTYRIEPPLVRMEKTMWQTKTIRLYPTQQYWRVGEVIDMPSMPPFHLYTYQPKEELLTTSATPFSTGKENCTVQLQQPADTGMLYQVWVADPLQPRSRVHRYSQHMLHNLPEGRYTLYLVSKEGKISTHGPYQLQKGGLTCIKIQKTQPEFNADLLNYLQKITRPPAPVIPKAPVDTPSVSYRTPENAPEAPVGTASISGFVVDATSGEPIPYASVYVKATSTGTTTNEKGYYTISNLAAGSTSLIFSLVGYLSQEIKTLLSSDSTHQAPTVRLSMSAAHFDEVVVVGYGVSKKRSFTSAVTTIVQDNTLQTLSGKVAGIVVTGNADLESTITIRGAASTSGNAQPLYVIDGVLVEDFPNNLDTTGGAISLTVLNGTVAAQIYGSRAAAGVILIQTGRNEAPVLRSHFKDNAYWIPNAQTNAQGEARLPIAYPDNITNWEHVVFAAGKKGRYGKTTRSTKAFKSLQALLNMPSFLIAGDTAYAIGKAFNYSNAERTVQATFDAGGRSTGATVGIPPSGSQNTPYALVAPTGADTLKASFSITGSTGAGDGEMRSIPVLPQGMFVPRGAQWILRQEDTTLQYTPAVPDAPITLTATTHVVDLLEKELKTLIKYPYHCMEQTASKLWGLHLIQSIKGATGQPFQEQKIIAGLQQRLLKNQNKDGGWPWWPGGGSNPTITMQVLYALAQLPAWDGVQQAKRNASLYLQAQLPALGYSAKLDALYTLHQSGHVYPYAQALDTIPFAKLNLHNQWQMYSIVSRDAAAGARYWDSLWRYRTETATGAMYWDAHSHYWHHGAMLTQVVAWQALRTDSSKRHLLPRLEQYLLEHNQWPYLNTVEKATIAHLLLTENLSRYSRPAERPQLLLADTVLTGFPATMQLSYRPNLRLQKTGAGTMYLTLWQTEHLTHPPRTDSLFAIHTQWKQQGDTVTQLQAGKKAQMEVQIRAHKEAEFVMIELPIPAGCVVTSKPQVWGEHREYYPDRVLIFKEMLPTGLHTYTVEMEVRYAGSYTLNAAKASLMYLPLQYGNAATTRLRIQQ